MSNKLDLVAPGLYVGDKNAAQDLELISRLKLTHIVTAELIPLPRMVSSSYPHLAIFHLPIADLSDTDLLSHLETAIKFIRWVLYCNYSTIKLQLSEIQFLLYTCLSLYHLQLTIALGNKWKSRV